MTNKRSIKKQRPKALPPITFDEVIMDLFYSAPEPKRSNNKTRPRRRATVRKKALAK
jgi:hypothetical protein